MLVWAGEEASQDDLLPSVSKEFLLGFGHTVWRHIHPDDLTSFKLLRQSLWKADKEVFQCRARFAGSDYEWWEFRFSAMPAVDNAEGGKDVSGILININDMKKREKELILMRGV